MHLKKSIYQMTLCHQQPLQSTDKRSIIFHRPYLFTSHEINVKCMLHTHQFFYFSNQQQLVRKTSKKQKQNKRKIKLTTKNKVKCRHMKS